jgi:hypothetical protein
LAIEEQPREDLLRDAVAYPRRLKLRRCPTTPSPTEEVDFLELFAGVRSDGSWSLYFDEDPVLQFTPAGALRRIFLNGRKYRVATEGGLVELTREGRGGRVELKHLVLTADDERAVRIRCQLFMHQAARAIESKCFELSGQVPGDDPRLLAELREFLKKRMQDQVQDLVQPCVPASAKEVKPKP